MEAAGGVGIGLVASSASRSRTDPWLPRVDDRLEERRSRCPDRFCETGISSPLGVRAA